MTKQYDNTNTASLWGNVGNLENEKQPVLRGTFNVDGVPKKVSLWLNGFYSDDTEIQDELSDIFTDLLALIQGVDGKAPVLKGAIEDAEGGRNDAAPAAKAPRRTPRAGRSADAPKTDAPKAGYGSEDGDW